MGKTTRLVTMTVLVILALSLGLAWYRNSLPSDVESLCMREMKKIPAWVTEEPAPKDGQPSEWQNVRIKQYAKGAPTDELPRTLNLMEIYCIECQADIIMTRDYLMRGKSGICRDTPYERDIAIKAGKNGTFTKSFVVYRLASGLLQFGPAWDWNKVCPFKETEGTEWIRMELKEWSDLWFKCSKYKSGVTQFHDLKRCPSSGPP